MQGSGARHHHHLPQAFHELGSASNTSSNSARSFSSQSDAAEEDAHTLRQLSEVLRERAGTSAAPSGEGGGWDDMQLAALTRTADILVVAVGYPELVRYAFPSK